MIDNIKKILDKNEMVHGWIINDAIATSSELFFVKDNLDMNRSKKVHDIRVTIYHDFEEDGVKYKGNAFTKIAPTMSEKEIEEKINDTALSASFVKNPFYEMVPPKTGDLPEIKSEYSKQDIANYLPELISAMYKHNNHENGGINSGEIFINKIERRICTSEGIDETYTVYKGEMEIITEWKEDTEEVEIFTVLDFSNHKPEWIENTIKEAIENTKDRAIATKLPKLENIPVILVGDNVKEFFSYYPARAHVHSIYMKTSDAKIGENIQGELIQGDTVSIKMVPELDNSVNSKYIDNEGVKLKELELFKEGTLLNYFGSSRISQYLDVEVTGDIPNTIVEGGSKTVEELKKDPYLELIFFSDFQMNEMTGDFGGEIRLGRYFDGEKIIPVTGGSISGNIKNVQHNMYLSKETEVIGNYKGPKAIKLENVTIAS